MKNEELLYGRQLLSFQLPPDIDLKTLCARPAMNIDNQKVRCNRCNTIFKKNEVLLPDGNLYCPECIALGRVTSDDSLFYLSEPNLFPKGINYLDFMGTLTEDQGKLSQKVIDAIDKNKELLLWAVTGAGKTEMMFNGLNHAFKKGLRVGFATPRVDVILELKPRFQKVFPDLDVLALYGDTPDVYKYSQFVLCTTHQLLRFYRAFDVLVIDEVDSFPFNGTPSLNFAAQMAIKEKGSKIYLSATPPDNLLKKVDTSYLPRRFHGHPLPVPKSCYVKNWRNEIKKGFFSNKIIKELKKGFALKERYLIFISEISLLPFFIKAFKKQFPDWTCAGVHAADPKRKDLVSAFREGKIQVLFTTTILERGVTIKHINVLVIGSESRVFNWASLVQIAGRAGRDQVYFSDRVIFYFSTYTKDIKRSIKEIKFLNRKAGFTK